MLRESPQCKKRSTLAIIHQGEATCGVRPPPQRFYRPPKRQLQSSHVSHRHHAAEAHQKPWYSNRAHRENIHRAHRSPMPPLGALRSQSQPVLAWWLAQSGDTRLTHHAVLLWIAKSTAIVMLQPRQPHMVVANATILSLMRVSTRLACVCPQRMPSWFMAKIRCLTVQVGSRTTRRMTETGSTQTAPVPLTRHLGNTRAFQAVLQCSGSDQRGSSTTKAQLVHGQQHGQHSTPSVIAQAGPCSCPARP
mmetsp:Transcript_39970/g.119008  ORF Transcript_39970/g.119008 Transcript_39970/m.119008 type:complete len:249 (-) Transcript_39970:1191-1937(-)